MKPKRTKAQLKRSGWAVLPCAGKMKPGFYVFDNRCASWGPFETEEAAWDDALKAQPDPRETPQT